MKSYQFLAKFMLHHWCNANVVAFSYVLKKLCLSIPALTQALASWRNCPNFSYVPIILIAPCLAIEKAVKSQLPVQWFTGTMGKVYRALIGLQVEPTVNQTYIEKKYTEIDLMSMELEQMSVTRTGTKLKFSREMD